MVFINGHINELYQLDPKRVEITLPISETLSKLSVQTPILQAPDSNFTSGGSND